MGAIERKELFTYFYGFGFSGRGYFWLKNSAFHGNLAA